MSVRIRSAGVTRVSARNAIALGALLTALAGSIFIATDGDAQTTAPKPVAKHPAATKPAAKAGEKVADAGQPVAGDAQPVAHARSAAISACLPAITELSRLTLDAPHMAISTWNKVDANDHMFSSIVGLKYENTIAPKAVAILAVAPNPKHACDGEAIQIQPSALACDAIQKNITGAALKTQDLNGVTLIQGEGPLRFVLMPTSGNGCTVVSIGSYFAK
jgi:hypothetical protein